MLYKDKFKESKSSLGHIQPKKKVKLFPFLEEMCGT
jgi:hypothetical protein